MKRLLVLATAVAAMFSWNCALGLAQAPQQAAPTVAIIDINRIFKEHIRFKQMTDAMKAEVDQAELQVKGARDELQRQVDLLKSFKAGTPDYKNLDEQITTQQAQFTARIQSQRKEFQQREAQIFYTVYREIFEEVKAFSMRYGINLVLRFNGEPVDASEPQNVLRELNKEVVYYNTGIDITTSILDSLNRRAGSPAPTTPGAANPATNPAAARPPVGVPRR